MFYQFFILVNLFVYSVVAGSSASFSGSSSCTGPIQVKSNQDVDALRNCQVVDGSIAIQNLSSYGDIINLSQLQQVHGDLVFEGNGDLTQVVLASLKQVDGKLIFQNNRQLERLDLTQLTSVQSLDISVGPALHAILFPSGLSQIDTLTVTDTIATKIEGLTTSKIKDVHIANNKYLKDINMNHLQQVNGVMTIAANSPNLTLDLSSLSNIYQGDFRDLAQLIGLNRVHQITGDLSFVANSFSSLSLPNITQIAGTLTVSNNLLLKNLSVPQLQMLGGALSLANNTQLSSVDVPKLQEVDGTVDITGNFDKVALPSLVDVRGGLNVQTSSTQFSCDDGVNKLQGGVTKGHEFTCKSNVSHPTSAINHNGTSTSDDTTSSANKQHTITTHMILTSSFIISIYLLSQ
ncbi:GPI anchored cell surface ascospore wall assembly protein [Mucor ambiguus]|uniref:GPI anchored cell surface ascospore wall assembly protein n=1 Tax=Mucor ambiguus TaxID=91626 RepID=A0A0C9MCA3_9FUNG|nr:GPI anchored cell surface ascospore wall assembly protein [Mucor ambiguus]